jgi:hypothetical protein
MFFLDRLVWRGSDDYVISAVEGRDERRIRVTSYIGNGN